MLKTVSSTASFSGTQSVHRHDSKSCHCTMQFAVFTPAGEGPFPVLYWLSGLTCTEDNFITKAGAQRVAAELGIVIVAPDTSPRGEEVPDDPDKAYDFGLGAGFYVNATQEPWAASYQMESYIRDELPTLINANFSVDSERAGIFGHSMGGHGALTLHLKNQNLFKTCSAFAPIVGPSQVPWGRKALTGYLGPDEKTWAPYDAVRLLEDHGASGAHILVDQGADDSFLTEQLQPARLQDAAEKVKQALTLRLQPGYDHSYYFVASFMEDHLRWHHRFLS